ncbi:MAG: hypothetical protein V4693_02055 [Pseudomonadota bacterium]
MSFIHEVGHLLDHRALVRATPGCATANIPNNGLSAWARAILQTPEVAQLGLLGESSANAARVGYYLDVSELWARSYTQWVAMRSGDSTLLDALNKIRKSVDPLTAATHWHGAHFTVVGQEIDAIFRTRGWI